MFTVAKLARRPRALHQLTGLTPDLLRQVLDAFEPLWRDAERARLARPDRRRAVGAGNKGKLAPPERVLLAVMHLRQGFTLEFLGLLFDLDKSNVSRGLDLTLPVLERALPSPIRARTLQPLPDEPPKKGGGGGATVPRRKKIGTLKEFLERFPELEDLVVDSTEQPRGQPKPARKTPAGKRPPGRPVDKSGSTRPRRARTRSRSSSRSRRTG